MPASLFDNHKVDMAIFDSYSKTVMRNLNSSIKSAINRHRENEISGSEVMEYLFETQGEGDVYPSEHLIRDENGHSCIVTTEWLYQAMLCLAQPQKEVLILEFWYGLSVKEIAKVLNVIEKTVYNRKQKAFKIIRDYYERKQNNGK